jgi:hypothetical protein
MIGTHVFNTDVVVAFGTIPGGVYTLLEKFVLRSNTIVMGARWAEQSSHSKKTDLPLAVYGSFSCSQPKS